MSRNGPVALIFHTLFVVFMVAPIFVAASFAPLFMAEKNGLDMSWTIRPILSILAGVAAVAGWAQAMARAASAAVPMAVRERRRSSLVMTSSSGLIGCRPGWGGATGERQRRPRRQGRGRSPWSGRADPLCGGRVASAGRGREVGRGLLAWDHKADRMSFGLPWVLSGPGPQPQDRRMISLAGTCCWCRGR